MFNWLTVIAVLAGAAVGWVGNGWRLNLKIEKMISDNQAEVIKAHQAAREIESGWSKKLQEAQNAHAKKEQEIRAAAVTSRNAADRLRNEIAAIRNDLPNLAAEASRVRADTFAGILGECVGEYRALAESADRHVADKQALIDAWPK